MFIPFNQLSAQARIWVYLANREIKPDEAITITAKMTAFCQQWEAHGKPLQASFQLLLNRFAIIGVDNHVNKPGGCAIDGTMRALKNLHTETGIDFLDRTKVACWLDDKIEMCSIQHLQTALATGKLHADTPVFDTLIAKKMDLDTKWQIPLRSSWMARYLPDRELSEKSL